MAPHAELPFGDTSGYLLSQTKLDELNKTLMHWAAEDHSGEQSTIRSQYLDKTRIWELSLEEGQEIEEAVKVFEDTKLPLNCIEPANFPLPTLSLKLRKFSVALAGEKPYFMIKGLKPYWYSKHVDVVIFAGIASHVGTQRAMTGGDSHVLQHVIDMHVPEDADDSTVYRGPPNRNMEIPFHNDLGDIISLFTLSKAASGGRFHLADANDIVAQLRLDRPDIVQTLLDDWAIINPTNTQTGYDVRPLLFQLPSGNYNISASRARLTGTPTRPRPASMPPLSPEQLEALDALHAVASKAQYNFDFKPGNLIFYNNLRMMHARDAYMDGNADENRSTRYLLRLILRDERNQAMWELPEQLVGAWRELYEHDKSDEVFSVKPELFSFPMSHG